MYEVMKNRFFRGLIIGCAAFLLAVILHFLGIFHHLEWKSWDMRLRLFSNPSQASKDIVLFFIDQDSLDIYEREQGLSWPWPREIYSYIIRYLEHGGARAIFIDLILSESSSWESSDDQVLSESMKKAGCVFLPFFLHHKEKGVAEPSLDSLKKIAVRAAGILYMISCYVIAHTFN